MTRVKLLSAATIRRCVVADPGYSIVTADYDQVEMRVAAAMAEEPVMLEAIQRGESLHKVTAEALYGKGYTPNQYKTSKGFNFAWQYGAGDKKLAATAGISIAEASKLRIAYSKQFPAMARWKRYEEEQVLREALTSMEFKRLKALRRKMFDYDQSDDGQIRRGGVKREITRLLIGKTARVHTSFGRPLIVEAIQAYKVVNYKIQSTSRDIMAGGLRRIMDDRELQSTVLLPVHDEIIGQALQAKAEYIARKYGEKMTTTYMDVPITAEGQVYGRSWGHGYVY